MNFNADIKELKGTPQYNDKGDYDLLVIVSDGLKEVNITFSIEVYNHEPYVEHYLVNDTLLLGDYF